METKTLICVWTYTNTRHVTKGQSYTVTRETKTQWVIVDNHGFERRVNKARMEETGYKAGYAPMFAE